MYDRLQIYQNIQTSKQEKLKTMFFFESKKSLKNCMNNLSILFFKQLYIWYLNLYSTKKTRKRNKLNQPK